MREACFTVTVHPPFSRLFVSEKALIAAAFRMMEGGDTRCKMQVQVLLRVCSVACASGVIGAFDTEVFER